MMTLAPVSAVDSAADTRRVLEPGERIAEVLFGLIMVLTFVAYGRVVGRSPSVVGVGMVALGAALVALTMALGG